MSADKPAARERTRVALVDDDRDLVEILRGVLERQGYAVVSANGPTEALELIERERPDLLVLDVMMPDATEGFHCVWTLRGRTEPYFRTLPIIMLTAVHQRTPLRFYPDSGDGTYAAGEDLPVQGFVDKPVEPAALLREIERVLGAVGLTGSCPR